MFSINIYIHIIFYYTYIHTYIIHTHARVLPRLCCSRHDPTKSHRGVVPGSRALVRESRPMRAHIYILYTNIYIYIYIYLCVGIYYIYTYKYIYCVLRAHCHTWTRTRCACVHPFNITRYPAVFLSLFLSSSLYIYIYIYSHIYSFDRSTWRPRASSKNPYNVTAHPVTDNPMKCARALKFIFDIFIFFIL